jgi:peroxidase
MNRSKNPIALPGQSKAPKPSHRQRRPRTCKPQVEQLETRVVMDVRSITGVGNNLDHLTWGAGDTALLRVSPVAYADGTSAPSTPNTLNPRDISNQLNSQSSPNFSFADNLGVPQSKDLSDYSYVWGQFIDHDMDLTLDNSGQAFNIPASGTPNDPMTGGQPFTRSNFVTDAAGVRQQINTDTSYLDLSQVYGSTNAVASILRTHSDGLLRTSAGDLLPRESSFTATQLATLNHDEGGIANDAHQVPDSQLFVAGDKRVNENIELTAVQTLFMRNHNRLATQLEALHPFWSDEQLYQEARKLNIAQMQIITYTGYLPSIMGPNALPAFTGYSDDINAGIATEFSTVGFRFGHSLLSNAVGRTNNDGTQIADAPGFPGSGGAVNLTEDFFRPDLINANHVVVNLVDRLGNPDPHVSSSIGEILKADASNTANEFDLLLIDEIRNILFGIPTGPGTDLAARDVQRARDHGIGTYNQVRTAYGLAPVTDFNQISSDPAVQASLQATYGTVDQIDPFEGMLAEDHLAGADVGPTVKAILAKQFKNLRDGDRFFYLNEFFTTEELNLIHQGDTLAKVIKNNTSITNLQSDVFFFKVSIEGTVFFDPNSTGHNTGTGVQGVTINLLDNTGAIIATTTTDANGHYSFTDQTGIPGTGNFTVAIVLPSGGTATTVSTHAIHMSRGALDFDGEDFGIKFTI